MEVYDLPNRYSNGRISELFYIIMHIFTLLFVLVAHLFYVFPRTLYDLLFGKRYDMESRGFNNVLVTGASTGIGASLAESFSRPGVKMYITSRNIKGLSETIEKCKAKGADVIPCIVDVKDKKSMDEMISKIENETPLDLVIANAGVVAMNDGIAESHDVIETNLLGVLNTINKVALKMMDRKRGQIVVLSSLAGLAPPNNVLMSPYMASKVGVFRYASGLRTGLRKKGVGMTVICPGFVKSRMTDQLIDDGLWVLGGVVPIETATSQMHQAIVYNEPLLVFPHSFGIAATSAQLLPFWIKDLMTAIIDVADPFSAWERSKLSKKDQ